MRSAFVLMDERETETREKVLLLLLAATEEGGGALNNLINSIFMWSWSVKGNVLRG